MAQWIRHLLYARETHFKSYGGCQSVNLSKIGTSHNSAMFLLLFFIIFERMLGVESFKESFKNAIKIKVFLTEKTRKQ